MAVKTTKETKKAAETKTVKAPKAATKPESVFISKDDEYLFAQGTHYDIYKKLGAHVSEENGKKGISFAVWAPNAQRVHVVGDFNGWNEWSHELRRLGPGGIHALFVPDLGVGELYKYVITTADGKKLYKADPYANWAEFRPGTASKTCDLSTIKWTDSAWMAARDKKDMNKEPVAIYECHIGSWMKHPGTEDGFYNYREFADKIVEYLKEMKYTHVELMGIAEHPFDGSWGYQVTGYYAPTSRHGSPEDFAYLVNTLHKNKIGVILDWVPAHFPRDAFGLAEFDGQCIYEHPDSRLGEHPDWGTKIFNYGKTEVKNFLIANALYWIKEFHIDGLRVDAVASMLYLDYGKQDGQWVANKYGGNQNLEAIEFFKHFNSVIRGTFPGVMTIAEESTAWPKVTARVEDDGLGFSFKWNMGWMHDFCEYMKLDPLFKKNNHHALTFAMSYNSSENYILPLSHDEVVHLKCSMVNKMPGYQVDKYANLRTGYTFMFGHAGKKLLFMGQEFGQEREWSEARELDWFLLENPLNKGMQDYVKELLKLYTSNPAMYENDNNWDGFEWINCNDNDRSIYSFVRKTADGKKKFLFVLNMTPMQRDDYRVGVDSAKKCKLILNSDDVRFGGNGNEIPAEIKPVKGECDGKPYSIGFSLPPFTSAVFQI
ncbi:MAG: 1,4-alpha-glucan branching protein GlgB [Lachnospiraceae bacterium]|nr:1,4-alpha-glucan branching protein GlgB [Lachnospiraceae bacterium]